MSSALPRVMPCSSAWSSAHTVQSTSAAHCASPTRYAGAIGSRVIVSGSTTKRSTWAWNAERTLAIHETSPVIASQCPPTSAAAISPRSENGKRASGTAKRGSSASYRPCSGGEALMKHTLRPPRSAVVAMPLSRATRKPWPSKNIGGPNATP